MALAYARSDARPDRSALVAALAVRRLDRTLTSALPEVDVRDDAAVGATTIAAIDMPCGGVPRGQLSEIVGPRSSGRTSLLLRMCAAATARGELVAMVDALDRFDPQSARDAGVDLERLLWIRGHVVAQPGPCRDTNQKSLEQVIKALSLVLQAGNFGLVACDLGDAPRDAVRRLPFTTWLRVQRMVDAQPTACVLLADEAVARSAGGLTVQTASSRQSSVDSRQSIVDSRQSSVISRQSSGSELRAQSPESRVASPARDRRRFNGQLFTGLDVEARLIRARARGADTLVARWQTTAEV